MFSRRDKRELPVSSPANKEAAAGTTDRRVISRAVKKGIKGATMATFKGLNLLRTGCYEESH